MIQNRLQVLLVPKSGWLLAEKWDVSPLFFAMMGSYGFFHKYSETCLPHRGDFQRPLKAVLASLTSTARPLWTNCVKNGLTDQRRCEQARRRAVIRLTQCVLQPMLPGKETPRN